MHWLHSLWNATTAHKTFTAHSATPISCIIDVWNVADECLVKSNESCMTDAPGFSRFLEKHPEFFICRKIKHISSRITCLLCSCFTTYCIIILSRAGHVESPSLPSKLLFADSLQWFPEPNECSTNFYNVFHLWKQ